MKKLFFLIATLIAPGVSFADQTLVLGRGRIDNEYRATPINVRNTCGITRLRLRNLGEKTYVENILVDFSSNQAPRERTRLNRVLGRGETTGWINLNGNRRCIDKIVVTGNSQGSPRASTVEVIGYQETAYIPAPPRPHPGGGRVLGQSMISEGFNARYVNVANVCGLRQVKLQVRGDDARIDFLAIRFANGQFQRVDVRQNFRAGSESAWKDLAGNTRCIDGFYVMGRSSRDPRNTRVLLIGK